MRLRKIFDYDALQAYSIISPTKRFKTMFPKKYIFIIDMHGRTMFGNTDKIPMQFYFMPVVGYIFTYEKKLPDVLRMSKNIKHSDDGRTRPLGCDQYFINSNADGVVCDLVLFCTATNEVMPIQMTNNLIIRCNSHQLTDNEKSDASVMSKNIKNNIRKIITQMLKSCSISTVEEWLITIIERAPFNDNDMPYRYPDSITDGLFKTKTVSFSADQICVGYDLRADSYEFENNFVHAIELAFEDLKRTVTIYDTYNGLMGKLIESLTKRKIKFEQPTNHSIDVKLKDLWLIDDVDFEITDFI